ncbi:PEP-CTERM sorting domain-containing protein [Massilia varians]
MKNILKASIAALLLTTTISSASAAVVQLGSISRTYGSSASTPASMPAGSCDTLNTNSVTVKEGSNCQRFYDIFDFSSLNYESLDRLELTLSFGATNTLAELWRVRFADSATHGSNTKQTMDRKTGPVSQTFTLRPSQADVFSQIAANKQLFLWFSEEGLGTHNFTLYSAKLDVYGTAVPEPASMALFGIALGGLGLVRRRKPH